MISGSTSAATTQTTDDQQPEQITIYGWSKVRPASDRLISLALQNSCLAHRSRSLTLSSPEITATRQLRSRALSIVSFPDWGDVPTWIAAIAASAAFAGAVAAYRTQAASLRTQRDQFEDQKKANENQAEEFAPH